LGILNTNTMTGIFIAVLLLLTSVTATLAVKDYQENRRYQAASERDRKIVQLRLKGMSYRNIAKLVDIQKSQVHVICKRYGL